MSQEARLATLSELFKVASVFLPLEQDSTLVLHFCVQPEKCLSDPNLDPISQKKAVLLGFFLEIFGVIFNLL